MSFLCSDQTSTPNLKIDTLSFLTVMITQHSAEFLHPHIGAVIPVSTVLCECVFVCVCVYVCACVCVCASMCMFVWACTCMSMLVHVCVLQHVKNTVICNMASIFVMY